MSQSIFHPFSSSQHCSSSHSQHCSSSHSQVRSTSRSNSFASRPSLIVLALLLASFASSFVGCTKPKRDASEMRLILEHDVPTLDPAFATGTNSGKLVALLFSNLVIYDEKAKLVPELASKWDLSSDGRTYRFTLRKDALFSSGRPVTSADVSYSIHRVLSKELNSPRRWVFDRLVGAKEFTKGEAKSVAGIKTPAKDKVELTLEKPFAPFLGFLAMPPAAIVDKENVEKEGKNFGRNPQGSGPYVLEKWVMENEVVLRKNPQSYRQPKLEKITFKVMNEPFTYSTEFKVGNLDMIPLPFSEVKFFTEHPVWKEHMLSRPGLNTYFIGMNCEKGPCQDLKIRQAISHAIDRALIVNTTRKDQAILAHGRIPPGLPGYSAEYKGMVYSPEKAKKLLKEANFKKGTVLKLLQDKRNENLEVTQLIVSSLAQVGMTVELVPMEWGVYTSRINEGKFDLYYRSWLADYMDAENFLFPLFHSSQSGASNRPRYKVKAVDEMIERAQSMTDLEKRIALYRKIEERVVSDSAYAFLFHKLERVVIQPWLMDFRQYPVFNSYKYTDVYLDEKALHKP